jgi:hypothetical protein
VRDRDRKIHFDALAERRGELRHRVFEHGTHVVGHAESAKVAHERGAKMARFPVRRLQRYAAAARTRVGRIVRDQYLQDDREILDRARKDADAVETTRRRHEAAR